MWLVKLGGSLAYSDNLHGWLGVLADTSSVVVVPGGGPFADQVRRAQRFWGFDESSAHCMALLAMEQFGTMLCGLQSGLVPTATVAEISAVLKRGETPVWMPARMVMAEDAIAPSWEVTSDSLSAWLCGQLGADALVLVKSVSLSGESLDVKILIERGILDSEFGGYLQAHDIPAWLMSDRDFARFGWLLSGNMNVALQIINQR